MELGHVEACHCVRVAPHGEYGVPGTGVELLPGHLASSLRRPDVTGGCSRGHADVDVAAVLGDGVEKRGGLRVEGWGVEAAVGVGGGESHRRGRSSGEVVGRVDIWCAFKTRDD